jgi:hypothetical protein
MSCLVPQTTQKVLVVLAIFLKNGSKHPCKNLPCKDFAFGSQHSQNLQKVLQWDTCTGRVLDFTILYAKRYW